ncbi:MAG: site-specific DNA-methyltransferase [Deltaproteobacteria bacterium]|nr:site-specific DNA-methyltransferase [Deltaproteobacteria bacterium]MCL5792959.1 site-specific DNA-methyltransferase [Deltaproteobacteria bacterium]
MNIFKPSDIYTNFSKDAEIVLHDGDTLKFLHTLPDEWFQLIITSPPYNLGKEYEKRTAMENYFETQEEVINELIRTLNNKGSLCWQVGNFVKDVEVFPLDIFYYNIFKKHNLKLRNRIIWHFEHGLHASKRFSGRYEVILWFTKTDDYLFNLDAVRIPSKYPGKTHFKGNKIGLPSGNPLGKNPSDLWRIINEDWDKEIWEIPNVKANHPEKTIHPCQFPIELVERCILALTNEADWVLDPYCGVGSSLIAGIKNSRRVVGVDKEPQYIKIARERIGQFFDGTLKIRPLGKPVYQPTGKEKVSQIPLSWLNNQK